MVSKKSEKAVSEILSTILLLLIAVIVVSFIYFQVLNNDGPQEKTFVKIFGEVQGRNVILEHQGGEILRNDTAISMTINGTTYNGTIEELFGTDWDKDDDGVWELGERLVYTFPLNEGDLNFIGAYESIEMEAIDFSGNSIVFVGSLSTNFYSDMGLNVFVDNPNPQINDYVTITIVATCYGGDVNASGNVMVNCTLPDGLEYISSSSNKGTYNPETNIWDVGNVLVGSPASLDINVKLIAGLSTYEEAELVILIDGGDLGTNSITGDDWEGVCNGLAKGITDSDIIPNDGSLTLSVVKFGFDPPQASVEQPPITLTQSITDARGVGSLYYTVRQMDQPDGYHPLSSALRLANDVMFENFDTNKKHLFLLITSGSPDSNWTSSTQTYPNIHTYGGSYTGNLADAQNDAILAFEHLNSTLALNASKDEFNVIALHSSEVGLEFLNDSMIFPTPSYITSGYPLDSPGFVYNLQTVTNWNDVADALTIVLQNMLNSINLDIEIHSTSTIDVNTNNNNVILRLTPTA